MTVKFPPAVRHVAHQVCPSCCDLAFAMVVQMVEMSALVGMSHIMRRCRHFHFNIAPTHTEADTAVCTVTVVAAMPDVAAWIAVVTMTVMPIGGEVTPQGRGCWRRRGAEGLSGWGEIVIGSAIGGYQLSSRGGKESHMGYVIWRKGCMSESQD